MAIKGYDNFAQKISALLSKHNFDIAAIQNSSQDNLKLFEFEFQGNGYKQRIDNWRRELGSLPKLDFPVKLKKIIE